MKAQDERLFVLIDPVGKERPATNNAVEADVADLRQRCHLVLQKRGAPVDEAFREALTYFVCIDIRREAAGEFGENLAEAAAVALWPSDEGGSAARTCRSDAASFSTASKEIEPSPRQDPDGDVQRCLVGRARLVDEAARDVERVAGPQVEFRAHRTWIVLSRVVAVAFQSQFDRGAVKLPPLRARKLKYEHIMGIEMGVEALRLCRRQIDVGLELSAKLELKRRA